MVDIVLVLDNGALGALAASIWPESQDVYRHDDSPLSIQCMLAGTPDAPRSKDMNEYSLKEEIGDDYIPKK
jgi:hypothetical protein